MPPKSVLDALEAYSKASAEAPDVPEAGAGHYLARGALQGISALADVLPNLYNLGKAAVGTVAGAAGRPDLMPDVGEANPIGQFLLRGYGLNEPVRPSDVIGGKLGAAALEGLGGAVAQGPMGLVRAAPQAMAKELLTQSAKNSMIGAAGGAGAELGGSMTNDSTLGRLAGGIAGGVLAPSTFPRNGGVIVGGIIAGKRILDDMRANGASAEMVQSAAAKMGPEFTNYINGVMKSAVSGSPSAETAGNINEGLRLREQIPGFNPSVAEMANSPGLLDVQKKFALLNPKNFNEEIARNQANRTAIDEYYRSVVPAAEGPSNVRSSVNQSLADAQAGVTGMARGVAAQVPIADQIGIGTSLQTAGQAEKAAARPAITSAYQKAFDQAGTATVPSDGIVASVEKILGEPLTQIKPSTAPQTVSAIQRIFGDKSKELTGRAIPPDLMAESGVSGKPAVTLQDLHDIRVAINQDVASARRSSDPAAATRLYNLGQVMPEVDAAIAKLPKGATDAYAAATAKYRDEYAPRFKEGTNQRLFQDSSLNEPKILPEKVMSEYFKTDSQGGGTKSLQFAQLFGKNAEAKDAAKTGILDIYRQKVVDPTTGMIKQDAHNAFVRDYGRTLQSYKNIGIDALVDIQRIGKESAQISGELGRVQNIAKTMKFDTVGDLADAAIASPKVMGNTLMRLGADRRATFNTILLDKSLESGTGAGMAKFLQDNAKTLSMSVPKEQLSALQDIAKALELTERAPIRGNVASAGADMLKNATGVSAATVFSQIRAVTAGRSSVEWAAINLASPALNKLSQTTFADVMENALHSPESAKALRNYLLSETPEKANLWARVLNAAKVPGKLMWDSKGSIAKHLIGPEQWGQNLGRAGTAIESQLQEPAVRMDAIRTQ